MNTASSRRFALSALYLASAMLAACSQTGNTPRGPSGALVGTWAEIVASQPANPTDGRQVIARFIDGRFKLVFVKTHASHAPCTGRWSVNESGSIYRVTFLSIDCFSQNTEAPAKGAEIRFEILSAEPARLRFKVPLGSPLAPWQARIEGGIE
jgi:hypothetical protein